MADYPLLAVLATGNPGQVNTSNFGTIPKLKVSDTLDVTNNITVGGTVDGVDVATLNTDFGTHDGGTAKAQHSAIGDHDHSAAGAEAGQLSHATAFSAYGSDDHTEYSLADGSRAFSSTVSGVTPTVDANLATKGYVDSVGAGLSVIGSCVVRAQGNINLSAPGATIDGITMNVGDRFLADQQSTTTQDGVYIFQGAATPATRSLDVPIGKEFAGAFTFIQEGTDADVGYVCTNDDGTDVINTHDIVMTQFSSSGEHDAGDGIDITTLTISVDLATDPGLQFTSNALDLKLRASEGLSKTSSGLGTVIEANKGLTVGASGFAVVPNTAAGLEVGASGVGINLEASSPSLQVTSTELGIKFNASGGLQKTASGTEIKIDDTPDTLDVDSSGIKVVGLPSLFKVNGSAVGATVTAVNLDTLTDGSSSVTLHTHDLAAHLMGSSSHTADTIANLNTKISDLIATYGAIRDIGVGTAAQRPAAGTVGRFWWANDTDTLSYDNGTTWDTIVATPGTHAASHQNGGGDEVATATPAANAIPKADGSNKLASGWISEVLAYADLTDDPIATHAALDTGVHGAGASTLATEANIATHAAILAANATLGHVIVETASLIDVDGTGKLTLGSHASTHQNGGSDETGTAVPGADAIVKSEGDGKIAAGWIDTGDITGQDLTWAGKQEFDDEITVSTLLMDGAVVGPQMSATIGTGGVTAGDTIKFDGTGQMVRRAANSDDANAICTVGGIATATGWYCPFGIVEVTWETAKAPSAYGEAVFLSQTGSSEMYWSTDVPTGAGKIYEGWAWGTGVAAKIYFSPRKSREIE